MLKSVTEAAFACAGRQHPESGFAGCIATGTPTRRRVRRSVASHGAHRYGFPMVMKIPPCVRVVLRIELVVQHIGRGVERHLSHFDNASVCVESHPAQLEDGALQRHRELCGFVCGG